MLRCSERASSRLPRPALAADISIGDQFIDLSRKRERKQTCARYVRASAFRNESRGPVCSNRAYRGFHRFNYTRERTEIRLHVNSLALSLSPSTPPRVECHTSRFVPSRVFAVAIIAISQSSSMSITHLRVAQTINASIPMIIVIII